jgi:aminoglycoside N3'-acetyltransferase
MIFLQRARQVLGQVKRSLDRRVLDERGFRELLSDLGFVPGATVMVHSSMDAISRRAPNLGPIEIIHRLQQSVTPHGNLLMPTLPFSGRQKPYIDSNPVFDVRRTPSRSGLLTEVFRRLPEVTRSAHPVCSVAAWGPRAAELVGEHHHGRTFGAKSPYALVAAFGGREVGIGTAFWATFSLIHVVEEFDPATRQFCFETTPRALTCRDGETQRVCSVVPLRGDRERDFAGLERRLRAEGVVRFVTRGGLTCCTTDAGLFLRRGVELASRGEFVFGQAPLRAYSPESPA